MSFFKVERIVKKFGGLAAVDNVSFEVNKGEVYGLIGPNGSGKTTIFNLISGFLPPTSGAIYFKNRRIDRLKPHTINRLGIARAFQVVKPLKRMTALDNTLSAALSHCASKKDAAGVAMETMEFCGIAHLKNTLAGKLTIGDQKRLEITRALATGPELLLLDEVFAGLNPTEQNGALELMGKIRARGVTIIIVEHIMKVIMSVSDRIHAMNFGQTITQGAPEDVSAHPDVITAYLGVPYDADA